jgi:N-acetylmuramoyl-L-alanine amidase
VVAVLAAGCLAAAGSTAAAYASRPGTPPPGAAANSAAQAAQDAATALPLKGKIVGIDPGHNGGNFSDPGYISQQVWNGREWENCDTTGTETDAANPYTEALFNFRVASYLKADLIKAGAKVVMTRTTNTGVGPCVNTRAFKLNLGHSNVAVDIHADGAYCAGCRGFAILLPVADGPNDTVIRSSRNFGTDIKAAMLARTRMPVSNYDGKNGFAYRSDLAGLNLTKVPKMLIEVGNMKNPTDAAMLTSASFQQSLARALMAAIIKFLG